MNPDLSKILNRLAKDQPPTPHIQPDTHINIALPSLAFGGAERMVHDLILGLALRGRNTPVKLFVLHDATPAYPLPDAPNVSVFYLQGQPEEAKLRSIALEVATSPTRALFTHLIPVKQLRGLWDLGVQTIPVVHNSSPSWQDSPQSFQSANIPFLVAVSESVARQLREQGCPKPIRVIRHELPYWNTPEELTQYRRQVRDQYGIREDTVLIGMVGQFKAQKAYTRAVRVLAQVQQFASAKLMILGGWDPGFGSGRAAYTATCQQALDLGVMPDLILPGTVHPVRPYFAAFDIFLNTSIYEGLSIAVLEAIQAGCPVVSADAGGNREVLPESAALVEDSANIPAYVEGIQQALAIKERLVPQPPASPDLIPRLWTLLGRYGAPCALDGASARDATLFVTDNMNFGGPQRSLCNLLAHIKLAHPAYLAILEKVCSMEYLRQVEEAGVLALSLDAAEDAVDKAEQLLCLIERLNINTVCFWNADAKVKLLLARVLETRKIKLIDVSPGPMYFDDMAAVADFQKRLSFDLRQYLARLDYFVAKYDGGAPPPEYGVRAEKVVVIPNGVPVEEVRSEPLCDLGLPAGIDPSFLIGTTCRIAPTKRLEYLLQMMQILGERLPQAHLVVVGGVDPLHLDYMSQISRMQQEMELDTVHFVGGHADVRSYLRAFRLFVMISDDQGCPNASLEAMAQRLPIIANSSGGTAEQVEDGVNGFLVSGEDPLEMAQSVELLLRNPKLIDAFGRASQRVAAEKFSMELMAQRFGKVLG